MTPISSYFARVGIDVDTSSLTKVDAYFRALEGKFSKIKGRLGNGVTLRVNAELQFTKSYRRVNEQLKQMGNSLTLTIKKLNFAVNAKQIKSQAEGQLRTGLRVKIDPYITRTDILAIRRQIQFGLTQIPVTLNVPRNIRTPNASVRGGGGYGGSNRGGGGLGSLPPFSTLSNLSRGLSGFFLRGGVNALPFIGGALGINRLAEANTNYTSQKIASNTLFKGVEGIGSGQAARDQLFNLAQDTGFNYGETMPEFNRFMASSMPALGYNQSFDVFKAVTQFGRTRGSDQDSISRALKAFSQMAGKGRVGAEELRQQLADAAGFGESQLIFAESYAEFTKSGLKGQKAIAALGDAMKKGKVNTVDVMPLVAKRMQEMANPGIEEAKKSATAAQARSANARRKMLESFSENGGEKGLATMWMALERVMTRLQDRMPQIGALFENAMNIFAKAVDGFMDISDALFFGTESELTKTLSSFGLSLVGIHNFVAKTGEVVGKLAEALGPTGVLAALAAAYGIKKATQGLAGAAAGSATDNMVDRLFGNSLASYATMSVGGKALRVVVVNPAVGSGSGGGTGTGSNQNGTGNTQNNRQSWKSRAWGAAKTFGGLLYNVAPGVGTYLGGNFLNDQLQSFVGDYVEDPTLRAGSDVLGKTAVGAAAGFAQTNSPWGALAGGVLGLGHGLVANADAYTKSNITQANPTVDGAMDKFIQANLKHEVKLNANIKIETATSDEALTKFKQELDAQVLQPFMLSQLNGAQSTFSNYAK